jgi:hypothetical protein
VAIWHKQEDAAAVSYGAAVLQAAMTLQRRRHEEVQEASLCPWMLLLLANTHAQHLQAQKSSERGPSLLLDKSIPRVTSVTCRKKAAYRLRYDVGCCFKQ